MRIINYDRLAAMEYARQWAFSRNPAYYDFNAIGGDCTNFASQCLFAGSGVMNFTPDIGWYYENVNNRAAAWTGVEYFYRFLTENNRVGVGSGGGPIGEEVPLHSLEIGDFVQFGRETGDFYHTPIVVGFVRGVPLLAAHTYDAYNRSLNSYSFQRLRCIHIIGVRVE